MQRLGVCLLLFVMLLGGADRKKKGLEVQMVDTVVHRAEGIVTVDGKVRNTGDRPIRGLIIQFDFLAPGRAVITSQKIQIEEEVLEPGQETTYRGQLTDPVRAVKFRMSAVDEDGRDLRVNNAGPFAID